MLIQVGARGRAFCQRLSVALRASIELSAPTFIVKFSIFSEFPLAEYHLTKNNPLIPQ